MNGILDSYLAERSLSMSELARHCGVSKSYLSLVNNGKRKVIHPDILMRVAEYLDIPARELHERIVNGPGALLIPERDPEQLLTVFQEALEKALDAKDRDDYAELDDVTLIINRMNEQEIPLKQNFLLWREALELAGQNLFKESLAALRSAQDFKPTSSLERRFTAKLVGDMGSVQVAIGEYQEALRSLRASLFLWGEGEQAAVMYLNMGTLFRRSNQSKDAIAAYEKVLGIGSERLKLLAYSGIGQVSIDIKDFLLARKSLLSGYKMAKQLSGALHKGDVYCNLGQYYKEVGNLSRSVFILKRGFEMAASSGDKRAQLYILLEMSAVYLKLGDYSSAQRMLNVALEEPSLDRGDILLAGAALFALAQKHLAADQPESALSPLNQCYQLLSKVSPTNELAVCCESLKQVYLKLRRPSEAFFFGNEAKRIGKAFKR